MPCLGWLLNLGFGGTISETVYLSTSGDFTVTNIEPTRTLDLSTATINDLANLIGTIIYDSQESVLDPTDYTLTNSSTDHIMDCDETTLTELLNVTATMLADMEASIFNPLDFTRYNVTVDHEFNCFSTNLDELADVLATFIHSTLLNTYGLFTVTNITATRTLNLDSASINELTNLLGTVIYDIQEGIYEGSNYTITGGATDRSYDADATSLTELLNVLGTAIADNPTTTFYNETRFAYTLVSLTDRQQRNIEVSEIWASSGGLTTFSVTNRTNDYELNCLETSLDEVSDVLATLLLALAEKTITAFRDKVRLTGIVPTTDTNLAVIRAVVP
uniref:Uncharacterized protein n=1 Tax=viral metagenome TaxID=1070528 RepID=A0A6M3IKG2_9ZZZZ